MRRILALLVSVLLLTACGASTPPVTAPPIALPTASPAPSPTPDVAKVVVRSLLDPSFGGTGDLSGSMTLGALEIPIVGAFQVRGQDSQTEMEIQIPGNTQQTANLAVGGRKYMATGSGPWFEDVAAAAGTDSGLSGAIAAAAVSLEDQGVVTKAGQELHRLAPAGSVALTGADLGMTDPAMQAAPATLEFFADGDGNLKVMSFGLDWKQVVGGNEVDAEMVIDFEFTGPPPTAIAPPEEVWTRFTSKRMGYSIGYSKDWQLIEGEKDTDADLFGLSDTEFTAVLREVQPKENADDLAAYVKAFIKAQGSQLASAKLISNEAAVVAGKPARRLTYHESTDDVELATAYTLVVDGRNAYQIGAVGPKGSDEAVLALNELQAGTFQLTP